MILVVNNGAAQAQNLKQLIEFMDTPEVATASPAEWRRTLGENDLDALFLGADLSDDDLSRMFEDVSAINPNAPIVMLQGDAAL